MKRGSQKLLSAKMSTVNSVAFLCQLLRQLQPPSAMYKWSLDLEIQNLDLEIQNLDLEIQNLDLEIQNLQFAIHLPIATTLPPHV